MGKIEGGEERLLKRFFAPPFLKCIIEIKYINFIIQCILSLNNKHNYYIL